MITHLHKSRVCKFKCTSTCDVCLSLYYSFVDLQCRLNLSSSTCHVISLWSFSIDLQRLVSLCTSICDALSQVSLYSCLVMLDSVCCCLGMPCALALLRYARSLECYDVCPKTYSLSL